MARQSASYWIKDILQLTGELGSGSTSSLDSDERGTSISEEQCESTESLLVVDLKIAEKGGVVTQPSEEKIAELLSAPLSSTADLLTATCTTVTALPAHSQPTPSPPQLPTGDSVRSDALKKVTGGRRTYKPLLKALKGINLSGDGSGPESVEPESSRARSRLEGVQTQCENEVSAMEGEYSTTESPLVPQTMHSKLQHE
jgi:hypothetical protein